MTTEKYIIQDSYYVLINRTDKIHLSIRCITANISSSFNPERCGIIEHNDKSYVYVTIPIFDEDVEQVFTNEDKNMLIHLDNCSYFLVEKIILNFMAKSKIITYKHPEKIITASYPYAIDERDNCYLFFKGLIIPKLSQKIKDTKITRPYPLCHYLEMEPDNDLENFFLFVYHK